MIILNLTQHLATPEQKAEGVIDLQPEAREKLIELLTFNELPSPQGIGERSTTIAQLVIYVERMGQHIDFLMIGGAPFLMASLGMDLSVCGFRTCFAFSKRESEDQHMPDGTVRKIAVFKHEGFIFN